ncbi:MAG: ATP-binding protein [Bacteroidales bacterium]|nr:ATP-binding protein [Bacteroidales bacterium]
MLEIDYKITRDEKDETKIYIPEDPAIRKMNGPIVCFQAPNGTGKSTLLNIISAAFYGHRDDPTAHRISPALQSKIKWLMERKDQKLSYELSLTSPDGKTQLISRKSVEDNDTSVEEIIDGKKKLLPFQTFKEKYFLIYEIPENPVEKLRDITTEVLTKQNDYLSKLKDFRTYLSDIQNEIGNARDEAKIALVKGEQKILSDELESLDTNIKLNDEKLVTLENYYNLRGYRDYSTKVIELNEKIKELKLNGATEKVRTKQKNIRSNSQMRAVESEFNKIIQNITQIKQKMCPIVPACNEKINQLLSPILDLKLENIIETHIIDTKDISSLLDFFEQKIVELQDEDELKNAVTADSFYNEIIQILYNYKSMNVSIPGIDSNLSELIKLINKEIKKNGESVKISKSLTACQTLINSTRNTLPIIGNNLNSLKLVGNTFTITDEVEEDYSKNNLMTQYVEEITSAKHIKEKYQIYLNNSGISMEKYENNSNINSVLNQIEIDNPKYKITLHQDEKELGDIISKLVGDIKNLRDSRESKAYNHTRKELKLSELQSAKSHKYQVYSKVIDGLRDVAENLDGDLISFNKTIDKIKSENMLESDEEIHYNDSISRYLAKRIPQFPYNGIFYEPTKIDLNKKIIYTTKGKEINTSDISTGQGMSMYIHSLLASDADYNRERKYIVIFDEAHTMDRKSFLPIKNELIKMNNNNRLMFALFVKPNSDDIKVIDLV